MKIQDVKVDAIKTLGTKFILTAISPYYVYENGNKTDQIKGHKYEAVCIERNYEKVLVKIVGSAKLTEAEFGAEVSFDGLELSQYLFEGRYGISVTADDIRVAKTSK